MNVGSETCGVGNEKRDLMTILAVVLPQFSSEGGFDVGCHWGDVCALRVSAAFIELADYSRKRQVLGRRSEMQVGDATK